MNKGVLLLFVFFFALQFVGIFDHTLWTPDEPRVAEIAREMAVSGDYLIPHMAYNPFLEKPPVYFAAAGFFYKIFGTTIEGVGRLASVLYALGTLLTVFFGTRQLMGQQAACLSTVVLATTVKFFEISHKMVVDMALVFFITAALFSFILAHEDKIRHGYQLFWISLSLAFLSKGIIGLAIPGIAAGAFVLWQQRYSFLEVFKRAWVIPGVLLVCSVTVLWAWVLYLRGGMEFIDVFYYYNQFVRFIGTSYRGGHVRPFYYYIPTVFADAAPWSVLMIPALIKAKLQDDRMKFFLSWFLGGLILLSISSTKRGLYFLPMYPAMAGLIALWMERIMQKTASGWECGFFLLVCILICLCYLVLPVAYVKIGGTWTAALVVFLLSAGVFLLAAIGFSRNLPYLACAGWALLLLIWSPVLIPRIDTLKSYKPFFQEAGKIVNQQEVIGYQLTETIEALSPFYGEFFSENVTDKDAFAREISSGDHTFVWVLPSRLDEHLRESIASKGEMVLEAKSPTLKNIQLWRLDRN